MEDEITASKENPQKNRNIFSKLFFTWMLKTFYLGGKRGINIGDIFEPLNDDNSQMLGDKLEENWGNELRTAELNNREPSLIRAISNTFLPVYLLYGCLLFIQHVCLKAFLPLVLGYLLQLFNGTRNVDDPQLEKYITGLILIVVMTLIIFFYHHTGYGQQVIGMRVRIALSTLVYRKMTKLSRKSLNDISSGELVNLLSNDVQRFDNVATALHSFWIAPFQVAVVTYFLWDRIGVVCLAGILSMISLTLIQSTMGRMTSRIRSKVASKTDYRVRLMNEIISGMQVIKMYAWEKPFEKLVRIARLDEVMAIKTANYIRAIFLSSMIFIERTTLYFTVVAYVLNDNILTSDVVFVISHFLNVLQSAVAVLLPMAIQSGAESLVSIRRIKHFLLLEERKINSFTNIQSNGVYIDHVTAFYEKDKDALKDISLKIPRGSLCIIVGPVGSGKSSILHLLLQELSLKAGDVKMNDGISFASQQPWIFNSSVKNNILFGQEYDEVMYRKVVDTCALEKDFDQFPQNDRTVVSEKGHSLSGGQKARINLARAIYNKADLYLLDDPLSAVDAHVAKHIFNKCILGFLDKKTRILVTHQTQFLNQADLVVVVKEGRIEDCGTFEEISKTNTEISNTLQQNDNPDRKRDALKNDNKPTIRKSLAQSTQSIDIKHKEDVSYNTNVIYEYIKASGNVCVVTLLCLVLILTQTACSGADYWISYWTDLEESDHKQQEPYTDMSNKENYIGTNFAIYIYSGIIGSIIFLTIFRSYLFFNCASTSSKALHSKMFNSLLKVPMRFFDRNTSGRILNRFSKDTGAMDEMLPKVLSETIHVVLVMVGSTALILVANYWMAIAIVVLGAVFILVRKLFLSTAKSIKHIEGIAKSPVFSQINSTLNGITTIRAFKAEKSLIEQFDRYQDVHTSTWFLLISCMASFGLWLDLLCILFLACIVFSFVLISENTSVSGAMVGMAISQAIGLTGMIQYGMMQIAEVVNQFISVERILQYTTLKQEEPFETDAGLEPSIRLWPNRGKINFQNTTLRYNEQDEPVLKSLFFEINPGEKIGIVGRTGAGKSSLISALFRLAPIEGSIIIDEQDTKQLGLHDVRSKISIIPQEPILFTESIRYNLDPFNQFSDSDLWNALNEVELKRILPSLEYQIKEGGSNFSIGQRQLICLARALIRRNKILVLDEATANVDPQTDNLIQQTIRDKFKSCTVLTIAHRLNTIMDSDKILVMDSGKVVEYDHPYILLQNPDGYFTKMLNEMGQTSAAALREISKTKFNNTEAL